MATFPKIAKQERLKSFLNRRSENKIVKIAIFLKQLRRLAAHQWRN